MSGMHQPCDYVTPQEIERWSEAITTANAQISAMLRTNMIMKNALMAIAENFPFGHSGQIALNAIKQINQPNRPVLIIDNGAA